MKIAAKDRHYGCTNQYEIGKYTIVEFEDWTCNGSQFNIYIDGKKKGDTYLSLEAAMVAAIVYKGAELDKKEIKCLNNEVCAKVYDDFVIKTALIEAFKILDIQDEAKRSTDDLISTIEEMGKIEKVGKNKTMRLFNPPPPLPDPGGGKPMITFKSKKIIEPVEKKYTAEEFEKAFGIKAMNDDLERVNCSIVGGVGHMTCGICDKHRKPRFLCGCIVKTLKKK